jgi:RimJ/RimL family protein N-acetyltransferase
VQPVEINAGTYYLRTLRADDIIDDRPVIVEAFRDPESMRWVNLNVPTLDAAGEYIALRDREWLTDRRYSWGIADPTTGGLLGEVALKNVHLDTASAEAACWTVPSARDQGVMTAGLRAALRFAYGALGLRRIEYSCAVENWASRRVARKCGFTLVEQHCIERPEPDTLVWMRTAGDAE